MVSEPLQKTFLREKSELKLREKEEVPLNLFINTFNFCDIDNPCPVQEKAEGSRRLTTVISPGRELVDFTKVLSIGVLKGEICVDYLSFRREGSRE